MAEERDNHWSSTHVRLRAELFLTGLAIFGLHFMGLRVSDSGLWPIHFTKDLASIWANAGLYLLFLYFLGAFLLRTGSELAQRRDIANKMTSAAEVFRNIVQQTPRAPSPHKIDTPGLPHPEDIAIAPDTIASIVEALRAFRSSGGQPRDEPALDGIWDMLQRMQEKIDQSSLNAKEFKVYVQGLQNNLEEARSSIITDYNTLMGIYRHHTAQIESMGTRLLKTIDLWRTLADWEALGFGFAIPLAASVLLALSPIVHFAFPDFAFAISPAPAQGDINYFVG